MRGDAAMFLLPYKNIHVSASRQVVIVVVASVVVGNVDLHGHFDEQGIYTTYRRKLGHLPQH